MRVKTPTLTVALLMVLSRGRATYAAGPQLDNLRTPSERSTTVEGVVIEASSGVGLPSVEVSLTNTTGLSVRGFTESDGKFTISGVPPGTYRFQIKKVGFFTAPDVSNSVQVRGVGEPIRGITLRMSKGGVIYGKVIDHTGLPRSNVGIEALKYTYVNGERTLAIKAQWRTDDRGEYRLGGLEPGDYLVRATSSFVSGGRAVAPTFFPGVGVAQLAVPIRVNLGVEYGGITFSLTEMGNHSIKFSIERPAEDVSRRITSLILRSRGPRDSMGWSAPKSIGEDVYLFENIPPGSYKLKAKDSSDTTPSGPTYYGEATIELNNRDVDLGKILLRPGVELEGRVSLADSLSGLPSRGRLQVVLSAVDGMSVPIDTVVDSEGAFRLSNVPIGSFRVALKGLPEGAFLDSAAYGLSLMPDFTFNVDTEPRSLELRVATSSGLLAGTVRNSSSQGVPMAKIVLIPSQPRRSNPDLFVVASSDQEGFFTIRGIPPGEYDVLAFEQLEPGAERSFEVLGRFENRFLRISVGRDSAREVSLLAISNSR